jgi:hypothetical protein
MTKTNQLIKDGQTLVGAKYTSPGFTYADSQAVKDLATRLVCVVHNCYPGHSTLAEELKKVRKIQAELNKAVSKLRMHKDETPR